MASGVVVCCRTSRRRVLVLGRGAVLQPEQVVRLQRLAEPRGLDGRQPVVRVVQQRELRAELAAHRLEHGGDVPQVGAAVPVLLRGQRRALRRLVVVALALGARLGGDAVHGVDARHRGLHPDRAEPQLQVLADRVEQLLGVAARGVPVGHDAGPGGPAEELVERQARDLGLDVPQGHVHGRDRRHGDRPAPPVRRAVEELPGVLDGSAGPGRRAAAPRARSGRSRPPARGRSACRRPGR